jgi:hypothetical protein
MASKTNNKPSKNVEPRHGEFVVADGMIELMIDGNSVVFPVDEATGVVMTVIAARKVGYADRRNAKATAAKAAKAERDAKAKERAKAAAKRKAERLAKAKKLVAKLEAAAA